MARKRLQHETIVWRDSWSGYGDHPVEPRDIQGEYYLVDVGFLAKETRDEVVIAASTSAHADDPRVKYLTGIPKKAIISRSSRPVFVSDPRKDWK